MKLLIPLSILALAAPSLGSILRGNRRNLANYIYKEYPGVCRKNSDGTGGGSNGVEYDLYKKQDNSDLDYHWCKDKCNNQSSCTGFEYRSSGDTSQCEVWKKPILGFVKKNGHDCMVKGDREHTYNCEYGSCRKYSDGTGQGNSGDEYDLIKGNIQYNECMQRCSEDAACTGVEYRWGDDNVQQCELWHVEIKSVQQENKWDLECCIKAYQ
jgi:hypothetical protein